MNDRRLSLRSFSYKNIALVKGVVKFFTAFFICDEFHWEVVDDLVYLARFWVKV